MPDSHFALVGDETFWGIFKSHWTVEIVAVLLFLLFWEVLVKRAFEYIVDKWKAMNHNISGRYIAYYDDKTGLTPVRRYSNLVIKQRGLTIRGTNTAADRNGERVWHLSGQLLYGHLISGTYHEVSHRGSRSVGSFFVAQQEHSMDFEGYWSGYDEQNHSLSSGGYTFKRKTKLTYDAFRPEDRPRIALLSEKAFGHRYFEAGIEPRLTMFPSARILIARDAKGKPAKGFSLSYMLPHNHLAAYVDGGGDSNKLFRSIEPMITDDIRTSDESGKIGIIQTICVSDDSRNRGLGRDLFEQTERQLRRCRPSIILSPAWNLKGQMSASKILHSLGYSESITISGYWKRECDDGKFKCPSRSANKCLCAMSLFKKSL